MKIPFYTIDAFTSEPFSGNPAAVCPLETDLCDALKQSIATEMNISETCYITKESDIHNKMNKMIIYLQGKDESFQQSIDPKVWARNVREMRRERIRV